MRLFPIIHRLVENAFSGAIAVVMHNPVTLIRQYIDDPSVLCVK